MSATRSTRRSTLHNPTTFSLQTGQRTAHLAVPSRRHSLLTVATHSTKLTNSSAPLHNDNQKGLARRTCEKFLKHRATVKLLRAIRRKHHPVPRRRSVKRKFSTGYLPSTHEPSSAPAPVSNSYRRTVYAVHLGPDTTLPTPTPMRKKTAVLIAHPPVVQVISPRTPASTVSIATTRPNLSTRSVSEETILTTDFPAQVNPYRISKRRRSRVAVELNMLDGINSQTNAGLGRRSWQATPDRGMAADRVSELPFIPLPPSISIPGDSTSPTVPRPSLARPDSPPRTPLFPRSTLPHDYLPYITRPPALTPTDFEHPSDYYVEVSNERERARAALEGAPTSQAADHDDLPDFLRQLQVDTRAQTEQRAVPVDSRGHTYQAYRSGTHQPPIVTNRRQYSRAELRHSHYHAHLSRKIEHCDFDTVSISAFSARSVSQYSTNTDGQRFSEMPPAGSPRHRPLPQPIRRKPISFKHGLDDVTAGAGGAATAPRPSLPLPPPPPPPPPPIRPDLSPTFINHPNNRERSLVTSANTYLFTSQPDSVHIAPHPAHDYRATWRPESWNPVRDLKECFSGWQGLRRQILKEHYRRPAGR